LSLRHVHTAVRFLRRPAADLLAADLFHLPVLSGAPADGEASDAVADPFCRTRFGQLSPPQHAVQR
jgi:hypothetical protein